jgi:hypothetical protein
VLEAGLHVVRSQVVPAAPEPERVASGRSGAPRSKRMASRARTKSAG